MKRLTPDRHDRGGMRRLARASIAALALLVALAGAATAASPLPLTARVLKAGELSGMRPGTKAVLIRTAKAWSQGDTAQAKQLEHWGFVGGVAVAMVTPNNSNRYGLSLVVQLSSAANARSELKAEYSSNGPWTHFAVPGIPGAVGFERVTSSQGGRNVAFALGPYTYLVGAGWLAGPANGVSRSDVIAAARLIYARVR